MTAWTVSMPEEEYEGAVAGGLCGKGLCRYGVFVLCSGDGTLSVFDPQAIPGKF